MVKNTEVPDVQDERTSGESSAGEGRPAEAHDPVIPSERPREYGGRKGPEPTRYGDWEKNGRCIDF